MMRSGPDTSSEVSAEQVQSRMQLQEQENSELHLLKTTLRVNSTDSVAAASLPNNFKLDLLPADVLGKIFEHLISRLSTIASVSIAFNRASRPVFEQAIRSTLNSSNQCIICNRFFEYFGQMYFRERVVGKEVAIFLGSMDNVDPFVPTKILVNYDGTSEEVYEMVYGEAPYGSLTKQLREQVSERVTFALQYFWSFISASLKRRRLDIVNAYTDRLSIGLKPAVLGSLLCGVEECGIDHKSISLEEYQNLCFKLAKSISEESKNMKPPTPDFTHLVKYVTINPSICDIYSCYRALYRFGGLNCRLIYSNNVAREMERIVTISKKLSAANQFMKSLGVNYLGFPDVPFPPPQRTFMLNEEFCKRHGFTVEQRITFVKNLDLHSILLELIHAETMTESIRTILKDFPFDMGQMSAWMRHCCSSIMDLSREFGSVVDFIDAFHEAVRKLSPSARDDFFVTLHQHD
jgi:hypothetical protein